MLEVVFRDCLVIFHLFQHCVSGPKECSCEKDGACTLAPFVSYVDVQHNVKDWPSCRKLCNVFDHIDCTHFTHYDESSAYPNLCFLFSECASPIACPGCKYGPGVCSFCDWDPTSKIKRETAPW